MKNNNINIQNDNKINTSLNIFKGVNHNHNSSNISEISYNALSTETGDINDYSKIRNKTKSKNDKKGNVIYSNFTERFNSKTYRKTNRAFDNEFLIKDNKDNNINKPNDLILYNENNKIIDNCSINSNNKNYKIPKNKNKNKINNKKEDDVINLLDNIKNKYQVQENKYINRQKSMKNEIKILKEQLKKLSVNEALYQVEIEKLKRNNNNNILNSKEPKINNSNNNNIDIKEGINSSHFEQKLDNIIQKYNDNQNNKKDSNKNEQLLEIFNLDKDIFEGENIFNENDNNNYFEIINKNPILKKFIQILIKKYKNEKEYRIRLEEKTIEIFTNDIKRINILEKKIKQYEADKHVRINSSLNYSYDNDLSEENITKNSYKSYDK